MNLNKLKSRKQEKRVAKEINGRTTPASGAIWSAKADVRNDLFLIECKTTEKNYYDLTFSVWDKIYREAIKDGMRIPVMCIDLNNGRTQLVVLRIDDLGTYPCPPFTEKCYMRKTLSRKRIHSEFPVDRFILEKDNKPYHLVVIPYSDFIAEIIPYYAKEYIK